MGITLHLEQMSIEEKVQAMETIWSDLCENADSLVSPSWHKNILREREDRVNSGDEKFVNWDKAKRYIQDKTF
ncbi:MAG: addiction module antitoxin RelB [Elusimicrobia bacterium HGW-Elusimicrobia-2]|nr:MAG: addiction module antitoxin RelB [Elusimicrobia bacterium HGW-Elusimicrobia-2]